MDADFQKAMQQHEERMVTMLEAHKRDVVDALVYQFVRLNIGASMSRLASESGPTPFHQPPYASQGSEAEPISMSLSLQTDGSVRRMPTMRRRACQHETASQVSETLRRGETEVMNWFRASGHRLNGFANSGCYHSFHGYIAAIYNNRWFEWCVSLAILLNSVLIGLSAEFSLRAVGEPVPLEYRVGDACCLAVFTTEIIIRWVTEGCHFLNLGNKNFGWNVFDLALVASSFAEEALVALRAPSLNMSFVRVARILRLVRVIRVLRVLKHLKELRIMVHGTLNCGKPLLWASLLLGLLAYMYVVFCLQISSEWLRRLPASGDPDYPQVAVDFVYSNFGSLRYGMYTLLKCITGGVSWQDIADPLVEVSPVLLGGFLLYILFGMACLMNLITAVFLEAAYERSHNEEAQLLEHIDRKRNWIRDAKAFFHQEFELHFGSSPTATNGGHEVDLAEFSEVVQAPRVRAWFEEHGLDIYFEDPKSLFDLIDLNEDHRVDVREFVVALYRLKGGASSLNLQLEIQQILRELRLLEKSIAGQKPRDRARAMPLETVEATFSLRQMDSTRTVSPSAQSFAPLPEELPREGEVLGAM